MTHPKERLEIIANDVYHPTSDTDYICIPIPVSLYNEFILRRKRSYDVAHAFAHQAFTLLELTMGDEIQWSTEHAEEFADEYYWNLREKYGPDHKGYQWKNVLITNGSSVRMNYGGKYYFAEIRHGKLVYEDQEYTPSHWASLIAKGTSRNAWRDLDIQFRDSDEWIPATVLRDQARRKK